MGTNYYRLPKLNRKTIKGINAALDENRLDKVLAAVTDAIRIYKDGNETWSEDKISTMDGVHVCKLSWGWKLHWACEVLEALRLEDIRNGRTPKDLTAYTRSDIDAWLRAGIIVDEYGDAVTADEIWEMEEAKKDGLDNKTYAERERKETGRYPTFTRPNFGQMYVDGLFFADRIEDWC